MAKRDYYEVLGVNKNADEKTLKTAYRKLAMEHHPDRNPGNKDAESKFKEAAEAYEVLSSAEKRQVYDRFGHDGLKGAAGGQGFGGVDDVFASFGDIFGDLFGGAQRGRSGGRRARRGGDLRYDLQVSFREAALGCKKTIEVPQHVSCGQCNGSGSRSGAGPEACRTCKGRGEVVHGQGMFLISTTCPTCRGEGSTMADPCAECSGRGVTAKRTEIVVDIPAGFDDGMSLRYNGKGEAGGHGGPHGDLYVVVRVEQDETFAREGNDLFCEIDLTMTQAALGDTVTVPTLEGEESIHIAAGSQPGEKYVLRKKGIADVRTQRRGDLTYIYNVKIPTDLNSEQKRLLTELHASLGGKVSGKNGKKKRGLFG